jgi:hypothetical protein
MRTALALLVLLGCANGTPAVPGTIGDWTPDAWVDEGTVELRMTDPGQEPHWFPVWLVVIDDQVYVRLGSRAAGRFDRNLTKPVIGVRIGGKTFDRVRAVLAPELTARVTGAMADKYWLQGDIIVRHMNHPYTLRLEPEPAAATP